MRKRGYTLVELMVGLVIFGVVMTALVVAWTNLWNSQFTAAGIAGSQMGAKEVAFKLAESFRDATACTSTDSGCIVGSAVQNATATSCTIYSRNTAGTLVQTTYGTDSNGNFNVTANGTTAILTTGATVALTYYTSTSYNATALTAFTPTSTTEANLIAVQIVVTVAQNGASNTYTTLVRLNNGPGTAP